MMQVATLFLGILLVSVDQTHAQAGCKRCGFLSLGKRVVKYSNGKCILKCAYFRRLAGYKCGTSCITDDCYTAPGNAATQFDMCLKLNMDPSIEDLFKNSRAKWMSIVTADLPDVSTANLEETPCGKYPAIIDDLFICGTVKDFKADEQTLIGYGTYTFVRADNGLPYVGEMSFNTKYLDDKIVLQGAITHEMGHVMGLGTLWEERGITGPEASNCPYNGANAIREFKAISGCNAVPIEQNGGNFTKCVHWDEACLGDELMTGYSPPGPRSPILSKITVGSLADLGYTVNYTAADTFTAANLNTSCICTPPQPNDPSQIQDRANILATSTSKPKLSNEGLGKATKFGQEILRSNAIKYGKKTSAKSQLVYAGNTVEVIIMENGAVHYVHVKL